MAQIRFCQHRRVLLAVFVSESHDRKPAFCVSNRIFILRQLERFHLRPILRNVIQMFHILLMMGQASVLCFHGSKVVLAPILFSMLAKQSLFLQDAINRSLGDLQGGVVVFEASRAVARRGFSFRNHLIFDRFRRFMRTAMGSTAFILQSSASALIEPPEPCSHSIFTAPIMLCSWLNPMSLSITDDLLSNQNLLLVSSLKKHGTVLCS